MRILDKLNYKWFNGEPCNIGGVNRLIYLTLYDNYKLVTYNTEKPAEYDDIMSLEKFKIQHPISFTKADLEDGMVVQTNDNNYYIYFEKFRKFVGKDGFLWIDSYKDDLTNKYDNSTYSEFNIRKVFIVKNLCTLNLSKEDIGDRLEKIWERPEKVRMTISEIEEKLGIKNLEIVEE